MISQHLKEDIVLQPRTFVTNFKHHQRSTPTATGLPSAKADTP